ncbi:RraA family protein [Cypionkella sp. TWP1-2-1b2]|uniref:RraA family protein n=1 Tax=Cypionkella sp. TWP1-2-1b2 TaxID=2804675 RepID=UPI003CEEF046
MTVTQASPMLAPVPAELLARWQRIPVAVAVDLAPAQQISPAIRPLRPAGQQPHLCARAVTVHCIAPDFGAVLHAIGQTGPGQVLVIAAAGHAANAMIGDVLGGQLHAQGAAGIICDGAIRDTASLASFDNFSVYSRHITPRGPTSAAHGAVNVAVSFGGCVVQPGDLILGDDDGLVTLPINRLAELIDAAEDKLRLEADWSRRLAAGDPVSSIFGLD